MIKKFSFAVLLFNLVFGCSVIFAKAGPVSDVDQACFPGNGEYGRLWLSQHENIIQMFSPTKDTLHMITVGLGTTYPSAKARIKIIDFTGGDINIIAQKYITVTEDKYYQVDFDHTPLSGQYYGLKVEMANQNEPLYWNAMASINGQCHPGGFAMIGDMTTNGEIDMIFAVRTYNNPTAENGSVDSTPTGQTSSSTSSSTATGNSSSSASISSTISSSNSVSSSSDILEENNSKPANDASVAGDATNSNKINDNSARLTSDKELQEQIALLLKELEENKYDQGAFGLQGRVGRILTWPVFYILISIIFLIIVLLVIRIFRKKKIDKTEIEN